LRDGKGAHQTRVVRNTGLELNAENEALKSDGSCTSHSPIWSHNNRTFEFDG